MKKWNYFLRLDIQKSKSFKLILVILIIFKDSPVKFLKPETFFKNTL